MPPASSDLAMDDAESVLWFLARSSVALLLLLVAASVDVDDDDGDGAAMACKEEEGCRKEREASERVERGGKKSQVDNDVFHSSLSLEGSAHSFFLLLVFKRREAREKYLVVDKPREEISLVEKKKQKAICRKGNAAAAFRLNVPMRKKVDSRVCIEGQRFEAS